MREQIEHDRVIRHLQTKLKRKFDVTMNVGTDQAAAQVKSGTQVLFPDLVLLTTDKSHKLAGVVEVETGESVHHLEAMSQWAPFGRLKVPFHLYVPAASADIARRLASDLGAHVTELWTYHAIGDQIRLTCVQKSPVPGEARRKADRERAAEKRAETAGPVRQVKQVGQVRQVRQVKKVVKAVAKAGKTVARAAKAVARPSKPKRGAAKPVRKPAAGARKPARPTAKRK